MSGIEEAWRVAARVIECALKLNESFGFNIVTSGMLNKE